jgi:hypothetical protein
MRGIKMRKRILISAFFILFLSILIVSAFKTVVFAQTTPKVAIVSLDHVPFVEGDTNAFFISAKGYLGQVQYQLFYIQESTMTEWKLIDNVNMVNGWTNSIDAKTPIIVDISNLNLKADKYRFAIRVRRVGVQGLKQNSYGDYDDAYPFNLDVVKNSNITLTDNINIEKTDFIKNENLEIKGVGNLSNNVQYKLHLFDVKNNKWLTDLTEYNTNINYSLKSIPEGTYIVDLWVKNNESKNKYDGWKLKIITIKDLKVTSIDLESDIVTINTNSHFEFPTTVDATLSDNTLSKTNVKWNSNTIDTTHTGTQIFYGNVQGFNDSIKLTVNIINAYTKINDVNVTVKHNEPYSLPQTVIATITDATTTDAAVIWNSSNINTNKPGNIIIEGTVIGYEKKVKITISVIATIISIPEKKIEMTVGDEYKLPDTLKANMSDGTIQDIAVTWNPQEVNLKIAGITDFIGKANGYSNDIHWNITVKSDFTCVSRSANYIQGQYIGINFSKNVSECKNLDKIILTDENGVKTNIGSGVPGITDKKCFLVIPAHELLKNMKYTLIIPKGTIQSETGEFYSEEIKFEIKN